MFNTFVSNNTVTDLPSSENSNSVMRYSLYRDYVPISTEFIFDLKLITCLNKFHSKITYFIEYDTLLSSLCGSC